MNRGWSVFIATLLLGMMVTVVVLKYRYNLEYESISVKKTVVQRTFHNYHTQAVEAGKKYDLPPEYLLALIVLESSGRKIVPHRFESHVFRKLDEVARGKRDNLDGIKAKQLIGKTDGQLKQLASSWGPFQIMGYKSLEIGLQVRDFQGEDAVRNGALWIDKNYGTYLRKGKFKDAFHIHNTGQPYPSLGPPRTYHSDYVPKGLKYIEEFRKMLKMEG